MGILFLVATPIGNLDDITLRAIKTLFSVDIIACEDTRKTGQLLEIFKSRIINNDLFIKDLDINKKPVLISYYDEIEFKRLPELIGFLENGKSVALVSNAGTPLIADPGYKLVAECFKRSIKVVSIPGPSSVICALNSSGMPSNQFLFFGFLPSVKSKRISLLKEIQNVFTNNLKIKPTVIFFESPHRIRESLSDLRDIYGDIEISLTRELTKIHEDVKRSKISEILNKPDTIKGELIILLTV